MSMGRMKPRQGELWVSSDDIKAPGHAFFEKLNEVLSRHEFDKQMEEICQPYYSDRYGRPSIPPGVYFRMLMIGYFEGIGSERGIAWRCADSLSLKTFLGLAPGAASPDHSSLSVIRRRLPVEVYRAVQKLVLEILKKSKLLKGRALALDATTMEANAAMRSIVRRDTNESYAGYVKRLAKEAGDPAPSRAKRARFDKKRKGRTTSNKDWKSPADPDARITKMKDGRTRLAYKPEHAVDVSSGAILAATVNHADRSDHDTSTDTLVQVIENLEDLGLDSEGFTVIADKGYHSESVIGGCAAAQIKTCISEPKIRGRRRLRDKPEFARRALNRNRRRIRSEHGKRLMRKRGETVERSFAHTCTRGGMRRTWLRERENNEKRYLMQTSAFNLGLVVRKLIGAGTPKGFARAFRAFFDAIAAAVRQLRSRSRTPGEILADGRSQELHHTWPQKLHSGQRTDSFSTGC